MCGRLLAACALLAASLAPSRQLCGPRGPPALRWRVPAARRRPAACRAGGEGNGERGGEGGWAGGWPSRPMVAISAEYAQLCQAQFEILSATVGASRCAVYFRREHPLSGALEFVPVAVYPQAQGVWVVGQDGDLPVVGPRQLPGATAAPTLIPNYPFVRQVEEECGTGGGPGCGLRLPDGGVSFPLQAESVVVGVLTLWTRQPAPLSASQCGCASAVARSLALSTLLDQRLLVSGLRAGPGEAEAEAEAVLAQLGASLRASVHQLGSPLSALRLFAKLTLRRLPAADSATRQLVREIVSQAARAQELVGPLQALASQLPELKTRALSAGGGGGGLATHCRAAGADGGAGWALPAGGEPQFLWLADVLLPLARTYALVAGGSGAALQWALQEDAPPVAGSELAVREAVSNLLENGLAYGTGLLALSLAAHGADEGEGGAEGEAGGAAVSGVLLAVWSSGPGLPEAELARVLEPGFRGRGARQPGAPGGSGLGLAIACELVGGLGGRLALRNAPAPRWLARRGLPVPPELLASGTVAEIVLPRAPLPARGAPGAGAR